jgi:ABC-type Fe3+-siderophore transport system permease subunit
MDFLPFALIVYGMIAAFALYMTHLEHRRHNRGPFVFALLGYALCLLWPAVVVAMAITVLYRPARFAPAEME